MPRADPRLGWLLAAAVLAALAVLPFLAGRFYVNLLVLVFLYAYLGSCWNIVAGFAGQFSLGHAAFFGIGAYASVLFELKLGLSPWVGLLAGTALAAGFAAGIGLIAFRYGLKGSYFAIATLAVAEIVRIVCNNSAALGAGAGFSIPFGTPGLASLQFREAPAYALILLAMAAGVTALCWWIARSAFGYRLRSIRENEVVAAAMGIDTRRLKLAALVLSAALTAPAGAIYAHYVMFVDPPTFLGFSTMLLIMLPALVGGPGSVFGPLWGAALVVVASQGLNAVTDRPGVGLLTYGVLLMLVSFGIRWPRPRPAAPQPAPRLAPADGGGA